MSFNLRSAVRTLVNGTNDELTVDQILSKIQTQTDENLDLKKVYSTVQNLATNGEIGRGIGTPEQKTTFVNIELQDLSERWRVHQSWRNQPKPKVEREKVNKPPRKQYSPESVLSFLTDALGGPVEKPQNEDAVTWPLLGWDSGEDILDRSFERLGSASRWFLSKVGTGKNETQVVGILA